MTALGTFNLDSWDERNSCTNCKPCQIIIPNRFSSLCLERVLWMFCFQPEVIVFHTTECSKQSINSSYNYESSIVLPCKDETSFCSMFECLSVSTYCITHFIFIIVWGKSWRNFTQKNYTYFHIIKIGLIMMIN